LIAVAIALACSLFAAAPASAYVYWVNGYGAIGRGELHQRSEHAHRYRGGRRAGGDGKRQPGRAVVRVPSGWQRQPAESADRENTGAGVLDVKTAKLTSGAAADFEISRNRCAGSELQPGTSCTLDVRFAPTASGPHRATLTVRSNDPAGPLGLALAGGTGWSLRLAVSGTTGILGTQATIAAVSDNFVGETPYRINIFANRTLLATCTTDDRCSVPFSPPPPYPDKVVIDADVGPAQAKPFSKRALVSRRTTASFTRTRPPICQPLTCQ
jgi:hypothetical protein